MNGKLLRARFLESDPPEGEGEQTGQIVEAQGDLVASSDKGTRWRATIFKFGRSQRPPHFVYTKQFAEANLAKFDGARVYVNSTTDNFGHKATGTKSERDLVAFLSNPQVTDHALEADVEIMPSGEWLKKNLLFAESKGKLDIFQMSIDATGKWAVERHATTGEMLPHAKVFDRVDVDIVARGAMGGGFNRLLESLNTTITQGAPEMKQKLLTLFLTVWPGFLEAAGVADYTKVDENQLWSHLMNANRAQSRFTLPDGAQMTESLVDDLLTKMRESFRGVAPPAPTDAAAAAAAAATRALDGRMQEAERALQSLRVENCGNMLDAELGRIDMPEPLKKHLRSQFNGKVFTVAEMKEAIKTTRDTFAEVVPATPQSIYRAGEDQRDKTQKGLNLLFLESSPVPLTTEERARHGSGGFRSIKEAYIQITGDTRVLGRMEGQQRFTESMTSSTLAYMLQDAMHVALAREYPLMNLGTWAPWTKVVGRNDFRTNHVTRWGGYGDLPAVAQGAPYEPLTSPTDEEATYAVAKKGGTETVTLEMIKNDDVGVVGSIPRKLARAAAWTLHRYCWGFVRPADNPVIYDGANLYSVGHANTGTTAMGTDGAAIFAALKAMAKLGERDTSNRLGIRGRYVAGPVDLRESAYKSLVAAYGLANQTPTYIQSEQLGWIEVPHFTDSTDWIVIADPADVQGFELGFLDDQREPEVFVSDIPNVGSWFTNDVMTFKIRHIYGGAITDYRAFYGSIVAGG